MNYFIFLIFLISLFINSINYELSQDRIKKLDEIINSLMKLAKLKTVGFIITNSTNTIYQNFLAGKECELVKQRAQDLKSFYDDLIEE